MNEPEPEPGCLGRGRGLVYGTMLPAGVAVIEWALEADMGDVVYRSEATIERVDGPLRRATLPGEQAPAWFGVHGAIAEHYGRAPGTYEPHATTIDYVVAATGG